MWLILQPPAEPIRKKVTHNFQMITHVHYPRSLPPLSMGHRQKQLKTALFLPLPNNDPCSLPPFITPNEHRSPCLFTCIKCRVIERWIFLVECWIFVNLFKAVKRVSHEYTLLRYTYIRTVEKAVFLRVTPPSFHCHLTIISGCHEVESANSFRWLLQLVK